MAGKALAPDTLPADWVEWDEPGPPTLKGLGKAAVTGTVQGMEYLAGAGGDVRDILAQGAAYLSRKTGRQVTGEEVSEWLKTNVPGVGLLPGHEDVHEWVKEKHAEAYPDSMSINEYEPKNWQERWLQTGASFVPAVIGGEATAMLRGAERTGKDLLGSTAKYAAAPTVGGEAGGEVAAQTLGEGARPYGQAGGAVLAGGGAHLTSSRRNVKGIIHEAGGGRVSSKEMDAADQLMKDAKSIGVDLTWPEAIQQVTQGRTNMGNLQRFVESAHQSAPIMNEFMSKRPGQVDKAIRTWQKDFVAGPRGAPAQNMPPSSIGPKAAEHAETVIKNKIDDINMGTRKLYDIDKGKRATAYTIRKLRQVAPGFDETVKEIRGNPALNSYVKRLPDDSVAMLDEVKKQMIIKAENAEKAMNTTQNLQEAAAWRAAAAKVEAAATHVAGGKKSAYAMALKQQADRREKELKPLLDGPVGDISVAKNTRQAMDASLPMSPLPGSEKEIGDAFSRISRFSEGKKTSRNLISSRVGEQANEAFKPMEKQAAGARFRNRLYGNDQVRKNLQSAIKAVPGSEKSLRGLDRMMEIFEATGQRQPKGSMTTFNSQVAKEMERSGIIGESAKGIASLTASWRERFAEWTLGKNSKELARIITDPHAKDMLARMLRVNPNSDAAKFLAIEFSSKYLAPESAPAQ